MKLAAIDIGSNAIRLQISRVLWDDQQQPLFKKLESLRFPLRLGKDVFRTGEISFRSETRFIDLMVAFRTLIDLYEVDDAYGCATSAMRDSTNGERILKRAYDKSGLHIDLISGEQEATILDLAVHNILGSGHFMHIDVGGGSSEINFVKDGESYARKSFKLGSVRNMQKRDKAETWTDFENWILSNKGEQVEGVIGTGGNIGSLHKSAEIPLGVDMSLTDLISITEVIESKSIIDRMQEMGLREDRADVIVFGAKIYIKAMKYVNSERMIVPNVGLKDGIIEMLYARNI